MFPVKPTGSSSMIYKIFFRTCLTDEPVEDEGMVVERVEDEQCAEYKCVIFYSFDPETKSRTEYEEDNDFMNSFSFTFAGQRRFHSPCIIVSSV